MFFLSSSRAAAAIASIFTVAATQALIGHYDAALALLAETRLGLDADVPSALWIRPQCLWVLGRLDDAEQTLAQMPAGA